MNAYTHDAIRFLAFALPRIRSGPEFGDLLETTLLTAVAIEKLLKGLLWEINPAFVQIESEFKHLAPTLYPERLVPSEKDDSVAAKPERDVVAMRTAIMRAKVLSEATAKHKGVLFALASYRDTIAHRLSDELDRKKVQAVLVRDIYPLLADVATELKVLPDSLMGGQAKRLKALAAKHQTEVKDRVRLTLEVHREKWKDLKNQPGFFEKRQLRTQARLQGGKTRAIDCPACGNTALLNLKNVYDIVDGETRSVGTVAIALYCYFCKLSIEDEIDLGYLGLL